jgi:hypothetical protein
LYLLEYEAIVIGVPVKAGVWWKYWGRWEKFRGGAAV